MIVITPTAGLCNRMRALDSDLALARAAGVPIKAIWRLNSDLNCRFEELFEPVPGLEALENRDDSRANLSEDLGRLREASKRFKPAVLLVKAARKAIRAVRNSSSRSRVIRRPEIKRLRSRPEELVRLAGKYDLYIETYDRFFLGEEDYRGFRPVESIRNEVRALGSDLGAAVGVHIRRTDHDYQDRSPTELFIAAMKAASRGDPGLRFFLASDSPEVEKQLEAEFPGRIVRQRNKAYTRNSPEGIRHAMIDLYCLASCARIIGSYASSFSETAAELGRIPCEIMDSGPSLRTS